MSKFFVSVLAAVCAAAAWAEPVMPDVFGRNEWNLQFANRGESGHTSSNLVQRWGRDAVPFTADAAAKGGAFDTVPRWATFSRRLPDYAPWQRVYNIGIRLVLVSK